MPAKMTIYRDGGVPLEGIKTSYRGFHTDPMSWDEVCGKFDRLTRDKLSPGLGDKIVGAVAELEQGPVKALTALLAQI